MRTAFVGFGLTVCLLLASSTSAHLWAAQTDHFLFTSFRGNGEDGLHLALSTNGYHWSALNSDRSFLKPTIGGKLMRDPCLVQGPDGTFHMVWTSGWTTKEGKIIGYAQSKDLIQWSEQKAIALMQHEPTTRNIWAPEIFYDSAKSRWLLFWSSTIPGKFADTDNTGDDGYNHRFYCATTVDFVTVSESRLLYDPGFNTIDATLLQDGATFYLILKDERKEPVKKNLRLARATSPEGPFTELSEPFTGSWVEGPSAIKIGAEYFVYFDHYTQPHYYGAVRSRDLKTWEDVSKQMVFPRGHRHGSVLRISGDVAEKVSAFKGTNP